MSATVRKVLAEALATFLFVFIILGAINNAGDLAPFAIGLALTALIYATGHISGAQLNPAVSLGVAIRGGLSWSDFVAYVVAQCLGSTLAALLSFSLWKPAAAALDIEVGPAFLVEALFTFVLVFVILNVATSKGTEGNSFYGLAIGATVFAGITTVGGVSGGAFNPAVALGLAVSGHFAWANLWLYVLAALLGGVLAAFAFRALNTPEKA